MMPAEGRHSTTHGRWSDPGLPHKGWTDTDISDLGPDEGDWRTCEMCLSSRVRYQHHMQHSEYAGELAVGLTCAGNMSEDYIGAVRREKAFLRRRPDRFRFVPGVRDITIETALAEDHDENDPIAFANSLVGDSFRGLFICPASQRVPWAYLLREQSVIPRVLISVVSSSGRGVPDTQAGIHWTVISYNLARVPVLAHAFSRNRYDLWILDRVPSFNIREMGWALFVATVDRPGRMRIYAMEKLP
ncbi:MAG: hypothetical protein ACREE2_14380 [Stellaceae bacterium]